MKRLLALILTLTALAALCGGAVAEEKLTVVATAYPLYDMAKYIGGELVEVVYAPEYPEDAAQAADVVLCIGGEADAWADSLTGVKVVKAIECIDYIEGEFDVATAPVNCMLIASYLTEVYAELAGDHNPAFQNSMTAYVAEMSLIDINLRAVLNEKTVIHCEDGSMVYFILEYGVAISEAGGNAVELKAYTFPTEEEMTLSYMELMQRNVDALAAAANG